MIASTVFKPLLCFWLCHIIVTDVVKRGVAKWMRVEVKEDEEQDMEFSSKERGRNVEEKCA